MPRYFTKHATALWVEDENLSPDIGPLPQLLVSDHEATDTGILNVAGDAIWCAPNPVGFGKDADW